MFDGFVGEFAWSPGGHWAGRIGRWGAGQVEDLDNLLRREGIGSARTGRIGQHRSNGVLQRPGVVLDGGKLGFGRRPAAPPLADGLSSTAELLRQAFVALASGGGQDDPGAEGQGLRTGMLAQQAFQQRLLGWRDGNG